MNFEKSFKRLEEIINQLENKNLSVDKLVSLFDKTQSKVTIFFEEFWLLVLPPEELSGDEEQPKRIKIIRSK